MEKVRTLAEMQGALDDEMAWRIKEISVFKTGAVSKWPERKALTRAGVALLYAHWEGFIKQSSELYLSYVESQALTYRELKSCFVVFGVKGKLNKFRESGNSGENIEIIDFILSRLGERAKLQIKSAIKTDSNLTRHSPSGVPDDVKFA